jgi:hypothetical protein
VGDAELRPTCVVDDSLFVDGPSVASSPVWAVMTSTILGTITLPERRQPPRGSCPSGAVRPWLVQDPDNACGRRPVGLGSGVGVVSVDSVGEVTNAITSLR